MSRHDIAFNARFFVECLRPSSWRETPAPALTRVTRMTRLTRLTRVPLTLTRKVCN